MFGNLKSAIAASAIAMGLLLPVAADAAVFEGTFAVNANAGSGLVINTAGNVAPAYTNTAATNDFKFSLNAGQSVTFRLFDIWTDETSLEFDDFVSRAISAVFNFTAPPPPFGGSVDGDTVGGTILFASGGNLSWDSAEIVTFGALGDGQLLVSLSDEIFNVGGGLSLTPGRANGASVDVTFKLLQDATAVPEPLTIGLLGMGLVGLGVAARRRR